MAITITGADWAALLNELREIQHRLDDLEARLDMLYSLTNNTED